MTEFGVHDAGDVTVIASSVRFDVTSASEFRDVINTAIDSGVTLFVIDLDQVTSVDASGLGALVAGLKSVRRVGGDLRVCSTSGVVTRAMAATGLDRVIRPYAGVALALASF